jgi:hypothetical protein
MGSRSSRRLVRLLLLVVAAWSVTTGLATPLRAQQVGEIPGQPGARASFQYRESADSVVLRYSEHLSALGDEDSGRSVVVYGNGRVVVHYPAVMTRAGDYTLQLSRAEMRELLGRVLQRNFVDLDERDARRPLEPAPPSEGELFAVHDEAVSTIELNLDAYRPAGKRVAERRNVKREVRYYALRTYARRHPQNRSLQDLAAVQSELMAFLEREDLEPVR